MFLFCQLLLCHPLGSACFHRFHSYYEVIRLLSSHRLSLGLRPCIKATLTGTRQISQVHWYSLVYSPCSQTPTEPADPRLTGLHCCLLPFVRHRPPLYELTRLNHFTLSRYGSYTPLPTLKPSLTASTPRLSTGCLLDFAGQGLSPR